MKILYAKYAAMYNFSYMAIGALLPLIGQYLKYIGFSGVQIGSITATGTAVAIFASAFWGREYNRSDRKHEILMLLCIMAAFLCFLLMNIEEYGFFLIVFGMMYFFQAPVMSLTDAFTVISEHSFGKLRSWGAVGFALGIFLAGNAVKIAGLRIAFVFYIISFAVAAMMIWLIRRGRENVLGEDKQKPQKGILKKTAVRAASQNDVADSAADESGESSPILGYREIFGNSQIRRLIICAFFMGGTNVANNTYFSFLYIEGGGTVAGVGVAMLFMVGSEVPFMMWCDKLSERFTMQKVILAAMCVSVFRFLLYGMGLPWWMLIALSFSQGAVNGILLIEFVHYVSALAPKGNESLAISSYYIIGSSFSTICCQFIGGILLDAFGAAGIYLFFGVFNLVGVVLYSKFRLYRRPEQGT